MKKKHFFRRIYWLVGFILILLLAGFYSFSRITNAIVSIQKLEVMNLSNSSDIHLQNIELATMNILPHPSFHKSPNISAETVLPDQITTKLMGPSVILTVTVGESASCSSTNTLFLTKDRIPATIVYCYQIGNNGTVPITIEKISDDKISSVKAINESIFPSILPSGAAMSSILVATNIYTNTRNTAQVQASSSINPLIVSTSQASVIFYDQISPTPNIQPTTTPLPTLTPTPVAASPTPASTNTSYLYIALLANALPGPPPAPATATPIPTPDPCLSQDCRESNNNFNEAAPINIGERVLASLKGVAPNEDLRDFYKIQLQAGKSYTIQLKSTGNLDLDLYLYDAPNNDAKVASSARRDNSNEKIPYETGPGSSMHYILVVVNQINNSRQQYELIVTE